MEYKFKKEFTEEQRKQDSQSILNRYIGRIPVICEKDPNTRLNTIGKTKFLCPNDMNITQFNFLIRQQLKLAEEVSIYLLINGKKVIGGDETMQYLYQRFKDDDGFLYITYSSEIIWG